MLQTKKSFRSLTARDLMTTDVLLIPRKASLRHAAHLLAQSRVSGAPVVDDDGRCVGVLSTTDFMRLVEQGPVAEQNCQSQAFACSEWQVIDPETLPPEGVSTYMTPDPVLTSPEAGIDELARMMLNAHIHRVIVVDAEGRPQGVVSSTDILAAVARHGEPRAKES